MVVYSIYHCHLIYGVPFIYECYHFQVYLPSACVFYDKHYFSSVICNFHMIFQESLSFHRKLHHWDMAKSAMFYTSCDRNNTGITSSLCETGQAPKAALCLYHLLAPFEFNVRWLRLQMWCYILCRPHILALLCTGKTTIFIVQVVPQSLSERLGGNSRGDDSCPVPHLWVVFPA